MFAHTLSQRYRMVFSRGFIFLLLLILLFTNHSWDRGSGIDLLMEGSGLILICLCTFGRIWASVYACGYKDETVIRMGPYSIMRNPLYFFSFLGTIGLGLASENILVLVLAVGGFVLYYPFVIRAEEADLARKFGEDYREYIKSTPRYLPNFKLLREPEFHQVNIRVFRRALVDASMFIWIYLIMMVIEELHFMNVLPTLFLLP